MTHRSERINYGDGHKIIGVKTDAENKYCAQRAMAPNIVFADGGYIDYRGPGEIIYGLGFAPGYTAHIITTAEFSRVGIFIYDHPHRIRIRCSDVSLEPLTLEEWWERRRIRGVMPLTKSAAKLREYA